MNDLIAFLSARLDEDEAAARAATPGPWRAVTSAELEELRKREPEDADEEDERPWTRQTMSEDESRSDGDKVHIARHDPARTLREVEARRRLISRLGCARAIQKDSYDPVVAALYGQAVDEAAVYGDHPDYRQEWKP